MALLSRFSFHKDDKNKLYKSDYAIHSHYDERGSGFFALGLLKGIQQELLESSSNQVAEKVVLITTSGSAVANLLPALSEARYSNKSLLVITADRPLELHGLGVNQTMEQNILASQIEHYCDFDPEIYGLLSKEFSYHPLFSRIKQAVSYLNRGTVQINLIFREPYLKPYIPSTVSNKSINFLKGNQQTISSKISTLDRELLLDILNEDECGVFIVGELIQKLDKSIIQEAIIFFKKMGWLVIIDPLSGLAHNNDLPYYDSFFKWLIENEKEKNILKTNKFIHLGGRIISKWWFKWLVKLRGQEELKYIHIGSWSPMRYDPAEVVRFKVDLNPLAFCKWIVQQPLTEKTPKKLVEVITSSLLNFKKEYLFGVFSELKAWSLLEQYFQKKLDLITQTNEFNKLSVFVGNSMPIRDYCNHVYLRYDSSNSNSVFDFYTNRGLSGIDGLVATSIGLASSREKNKEFSNHSIESASPLFHSVMGDLAFLHDLNSLALLRELKQVKVIFFIINNQEGTIFKHIGLGKELEKKIKGPNDTVSQSPANQFYYQHEFKFKSAAELFGLSYYKISNEEELISSLDKISKLEQINKISNHYLIEITSDSKKNLIEHQMFSQAFDQYLNSINFDV